MAKQKKVAWNVLLQEERAEASGVSEEQIGDNPFAEGNRGRNGVQKDDNREDNRRNREAGENRDRLLQLNRGSINDILYLHPNDHAGIQLVGAPLTGNNFYGNNFYAWSRSIRRALGARNKLDFINGDLPEPEPESPYYKAWLKADYMVNTWIINSISKELASAFQYIEDSKSLWDEIKQRFDRSSGPKIYRIRRELSGYTQGNQSVMVYFNHLNAFWDELNLLKSNQPHQELRIKKNSFLNVVYFVVATSFLYKKSISLKKIYPRQYINNLMLGRNTIYRSCLIVFNFLSQKSEVRSRTVINLTSFEKKKKGGMDSHIYAATETAVPTAAESEPSHSDSVAAPSSAAINASAAAGVRLVRVVWTDTSGQHRCRVVPEKRFDDVVRKNGIGIPCAVMGLVSLKDSIADETNLTEVGEIRLLPDLSTKAIIPWTKGQEMVISDMHLKPGTPWDLCPRETLRRVSKVLKNEFNLVMNAGFENEFYLLRRELVDGKEKWVPFDTTPYCSTSAIDQALPLLSEIVDSLHSLNIVVEQVHSEIGYGQYEVVLGYTTCEQAADNLVYTREVIRAVARKHGLLATFVPKYSLDDMGSGSHVHISLSENGQNVFVAHNGEGRYGMSKIGEAFMAGVLDHLPSILAFTAPVPNSYDRIQPNTLSGAYLCWGMDNREAPLRTACPPGTPDGAVSNFEIKVFDGCANPYLGLASVMAAGIDGLRRHSTLPEPIDANPDTIRSSVQRLPGSLSESVEALDRDEVLQELIGQRLSAVVKGVRKAEIKYDSEHKDARKDLIHRY